MLQPAAASARGIPHVAHFVWLGPAFPWLHYVALRSAAERSGLQVVLHHSDDLRGQPWFDALNEVPKVKSRRLDVAELLRVYPTAQRRALQRCLAEARCFSQQSDIYRLLLLATYGGVYLDMDTVTVRSLVDLCDQNNAFVGQEYIVYPYWLQRRRNAWRLPVAWLRAGLRGHFRRQAHGWRQFRHFQACFHTAANNAVLGSRAAAPFVCAALDDLLALEATRRRASRSAIGPHLLQRLLATHAHDEVMQLPPAVFSPLAPEISEHWFRLQSHFGAQALLCPETRVVHWYASVRTRDWLIRLDPAFVRAHAREQLISDLCLPFAG